MASGYMIAARQTKAERMARLLADHYGADAATAAKLPLPHRRIVAELAGCRPPSEATWQVVVDCLRSWEAIPPAPTSVVLESYDSDRAEYRAFHGLTEPDGCPRCASGYGPPHAPFTAGHVVHCSCNGCW